MSVFFMLRLSMLPQPANQFDKVQILKLNPTEFTVKNEICTGIASSKNEKFSFLIDRLDGRIKQNAKQIIYLRTDDFEVEKVKSATNPAEVNFQKYYFSKNVFHTLKIHSFQIMYSTPSTLTDRVLLLRWQLSEYFKKLPATLRFNTNSLLLGLNEKDMQSKSYLSDFTKLGIIHLFSLSGMHLLLLISFLKRLISWTRICTIETLEMLLFVILPIYCVLVGTNTSICRATILVLTKILVNKSNIQTTSTEIFGISLIMGLFLNPKCLLLLGGQLTYLLSFSLIYLWRLSIFKLSFMINLLCMPLIILNNYEISLTTIPINVLVAPIFEYFILPTTLIFALIGNINSRLTQFVDSLTVHLYNICHQISQIRIFQLITGKFPLVIVLLLIVLVLFAITNKRKSQKELLIFTVIFGLCLAINKFPLTGQVSLIDVGQGDSILITTPINRQTFLIDTGGKLAFGGHRITNFNVDKITIPYLKSQGITKIDAIFMSHQDSDHIGDLGELLKQFPVKSVYFGNGMQNNPKVRRVLQPYSHKIQIQAVGAGDLLQFSALNFKVLSPLRPGIGENEDSMVLTTNICAKDWMFTGDLPRAKELAVVNKFHPHVDYLKVGHHGSKTSSDPEFIKQIHPESAFISVGRKNRYGHPNKETIDTLKANHVKIFKTSEYGMIIWQYNFYQGYKLNKFLGK